MILNYQSLCLLHFLKFSTLEPSCQIVYGQITKNIDRIDDRKLAITFKVPNPTHFCWYYVIEKGSRNRSRAVSVRKSMEVTWFLPILYKILFQIMFLSKIYGFSKKKNCVEITKKPLRTRSKQKISHVFYISKVSISQGIQPIYDIKKYPRIPDLVLHSFICMISVSLAIFGQLVWWGVELCRMVTVNKRFWAQKSKIINSRHSP